MHEIMCLRMRAGRSCRGGGIGGSFRGRISTRVWSSACHWESIWIHRRVQQGHHKDLLNFDQHFGRVWEWWYTLTLTCQNHPSVPQIHPNCNCRPIPPGHWAVGASSKSALLWQKPTYSGWVLLNLAGFFLLILRRRRKSIHPMYIWVLTMTIPVI